MAWKADWADWVSAGIVEAFREDYLPGMPPLGEGGYLVSYLLEIGPTQAGGMGSAPIGHESIRAWQDNIGIELEPWECRFLRRLSREYLAESHRAEKLGAQAPFLAEGMRPEVTKVQDAIRALAQL